MTDFQVQLGDLANRLGRALGITGKINTLLRDPTLPVVLVADMSDAPYADAPAYFSAFLSQTGAAGQFSYIGFQAAAPRTRVISASVDSTGGATGIGASAIIFRGVTGAIAAGGPFASTSLRGISQGFAIQANTSAALGGATSVSLASAFIGSTIERNFIRELAPAPVVLFPGDAFVIQATGAATNIRASIEVAEYPR